MGGMQNIDSCKSSCYGVSNSSSQAVCSCWVPPSALLRLTSVSLVMALFLSGVHHAQGHGGEELRGDHTPAVHCTECQGAHPCHAG